VRNAGNRDGPVKRVAGIDCGTNSIRLLIADVCGDDAGGLPRLMDLHRQMRVVRLGEGVDRTGLISPQALARTRAALTDYAELIRQYSVVATRMVATSASRDAGNSDEFAAMVRELLGIDPEVITGLAEAELSFTGAVAGLPGAADPLLVADIGGGSTELVLGTGVTGGTGRPSVLAAHSMDVGCVRMTERHLHTDPPRSAEIEATLADLRSALAVAGTVVPVREAASFVGVAGTVTTIAAMALGLPRYDAAAIHGSVISYRQVAEVTDQLLAMTHQERAAIPVMHPGRVDVIGGGALVLRTVLEFVGADAVIAGEHDILDGITLSAAGWR
jgi:exopolyphosphatase / guanosine-5'-triphosphate,3'-diphosphate pyrophosphatase